MLALITGAPGTGKTTTALRMADRGARHRLGVAWLAGMDPPDELAKRWERAGSWVAWWRAGHPTRLLLDAEDPTHLFAHAGRLALNDELGAVVIDELHSALAWPGMTEHVERLARTHRHSHADWLLATQAMVRLPAGMLTLLRATADMYVIHRTYSRRDIREVCSYDYDREGEWPRWTHGRELQELLGRREMGHSAVVVDHARGVYRWRL